MVKVIRNSMLVYFMIWANAFAGDYAELGDLKTFFTTVSERSKLNAMRESGQFSKKQPGTGFSVSVEPKKVKVRGIVMRENGEPVVWVNEGNTLKSRKIDNDIKVNTKRIKPAARIPLKVNNRHLMMKPGQEWTESSNKIEDNYQTK